MLPRRPGRLLPGAERPRREPRALELVLALTAVVLLALGCLHLIALLGA